jgi:WD40 repeat protein
VDIETGAELSAPGMFAGHTEAVQDVAGHPDGRQVLSAGLDQLVILWDAENRA